jgi:fermentation-respiration switch protein FrsA (DUF1100 family)
LQDTFIKPLSGSVETTESGAIVLYDEQGPFEMGSEFFHDLDQHDCPQYLKDFGQRPMLVIQGENDEVVNPENARFIQQQAAGPVELHMVPGADHRFTEHQSVREEITLGWLKKVFVD